MQLIKSFIDLIFIQERKSDIKYMLRDLQAVHQSDAPRDSCHSTLPNFFER